MNVLHITAGYPTEEKPQDGSFIHSQVLSLRQQGIKTDVHVLRGYKIFKYLKGIFDLRKLIKKNNYDLIHAHYMYAGWTARLSSNLPLVVSFMGSDVLGGLGNKGEYKFISKFLHKFFSNLLLSISSAGICKSNNLAIQFKHKAKVKVVPNGVDINIFYPNIEIDRVKLGLSNNSKYILFGGNPEYKAKRFKLALEAIQILKEKIKNVELIYLVDKKPTEVAAYLNTCDCLLLTSTHEGSPNIVKEALACNLPVVSLNVGDVEERICDVENCYIATSEPNDIADKLYKVITKSYRAINGFEKVSSINSEIIAKKIIMIYERLLSIN